MPAHAIWLRAACARVPLHLAQAIAGLRSRPAARASVRGNWAKGALPLQCVVRHTLSVLAFSTYVHILTFILYVYAQPVHTFGG